MGCRAGRKTGGRRNKGVGENAILLGVAKSVGWDQMPRHPRLDTPAQLHHVISPGSEDLRLDVQFRRIVKKIIAAI
jgi:hypothetical protein